MTKLIDFFLGLEKIRKTEETVFIRNKKIKLNRLADHAFEEAVFSLLIARKKNIDPEKLIKMILVAKIYQGCTDEKEWKRFVSCLPSNIKREFSLLKNQFLGQRTKISKLAKQIILAEKIIFLTNKQAKDYFKENQGQIQDQDIKKIAKALISFKNFKRPPKNDFERFAKFLTQISLLQKFKRKGWVLRGVKDPETVAQHTFHFMIASWILGDKKGFGHLRMILLALTHDLCEVYAGDRTPHDPLGQLTKEDLKNPPRVPRQKKVEWVMQKKQAEWLGIKKVTEVLPIKLAKEIRNLWLEFEERLTKEGRFTYLLDKVENLFQATNYWLEDENFPIVAWWVYLKEILDDPLLLKTIAELDKKFSYKLLKLNGPSK